MPHPDENFSIPRRVLEAVLDIFFPRECLVSGALPAFPPYRFLSAAGRAKLSFLGEEVCPSCGAPKPAAATCADGCVFCRGRKFHFGRSRSVVRFDVPARRLVHALKYESIHAAIGDLAALAAESEPFVRHLEGAVLVPVPLFPARERLRNYNQSRIFCEKLTRVIAGTQVETPLVRVRDTPTQTRLSAEERIRNVHGAFRVSEKFAATISPKKRYVVVDDVFTTGSTLSECARALKKAGARTVDAATFAHG